jgi:hypothetical protein
VENPVTLYPTADEGKKTAPKKNAAAAASATTPGASLENLKIGDTLSGQNAPQVAGKPLTITCEVETKARDGVIVAHGGASVGYALYIKDGHVVFALHNPNRDTVRITSPTMLADKAIIEARIAADGAMTLTLDGKSVASGKADGPPGRQPVENFCVGHDDKVPVDDYDGKARFNGSIRSLKIDNSAFNSPH